MCTIIHGVTELGVITCQLIPWSKKNSYSNINPGVFTLSYNEGTVLQVLWHLISLILKYRNAASAPIWPSDYWCLAEKMKNKNIILTIYYICYGNHPAFKRYTASQASAIFVLISVFFLLHMNDCFCSSIHLVLVWPFQPQHAPVLFYVSNRRLVWFPLLHKAVSRMTGWLISSATTSQDSTVNSKNVNKKAKLGRSTVTSL